MVMVSRFSLFTVPRSDCTETFAEFCTTTNVPSAVVNGDEISTGRTTVALTPIKAVSVCKDVPPGVRATSTAQATEKLIATLTLRG